jgi:hypothetical protein
MQEYLDTQVEAGEQVLWAGTTNVPVTAAPRAVVAADLGRDTGLFSVIPVMLLHTGANVISAFIPTPVDVLGGLGDMFLRGIVYWGITIVLLFVTRGTLGYAPKDTIEGLPEPELT